MSRFEREHPGEGGARAAVNRHRNAKYQTRYSEDARGWPIPWMVEEGFAILSKAGFYIHCRCMRPLIFSQFEREECKRLARLYLAQSAKCDRPKLP